MKKFIKKILLFIPVCLVFYITLICIMGSTKLDKYNKNLTYTLGKRGHLHTRLLEVEQTKNVDILFLGSSHTYRGFDPRIFKKFGYRTFNLGSSSQTPLQTSYLLDKYLDHLNPKLIIYEVFPTAFKGDGIESSIDLISNSNIDFKLIQLGLSHMHLKVFNTLIYSIFDNIFNDKKDYSEPIHIKDDKYIGDGYVQKDLKYFQIKNYKDDILLFNNSQFDKFGTIINRIRSKGIKLIFVLAPISKNFYNSFSNFDTFNDKIKSYGTYYNFNDIVELHDSLHFYDAHHLNQLGVEIFNYSMFKVIHELNQLEKPTN